MTKEKLLYIAERNVRKSEKSLEQGQRRTGITAEELENLMNNREYTLYVLELIRKYTDDQCTMLTERKE